ncbi:MAG: xanthine dehydrogenase family protein molybdopterin-binding subunit [Pseudomonadota bacterium]
MNFSAVGKRVFRTDAIEKVTGRAEYCVDLVLPWMLYGKILRSPYPHARIIEIDTKKAESLNGVRAVITARDVPDTRYGLGLNDEPIMARDKVRYIGEPVAAVAAETLEIAEEALELIEVTYEELPAVFDPEEAMEINPSVIIHSDLPHYKALPVLPPKLDPERPNICNHLPIRVGDVEQGFKEADYVLENKFTTSMVSHCPMEPHNCVAKVEPDGSVTVWTSHQALPLAKSQLSDAFLLSPSKIRIRGPYVGGGFGCKTSIKGEGIGVALAQKANRPVKIVLTREEVFSCTSGRFPFVIYLKDGFKKDGTITAREVKLILNAGAYSEAGYLTVRNVFFGIAGQYKTPHFKFDSYGVYTNHLPSGAFRGFGSPEVLFAIESHMDMIAEKLSLDPVEFRMKNALKEGETNILGEMMQSVGAIECLKKVSDAIEWGKKTEGEGAWKTGKGIALGNKYSLAPTASQAAVKVHHDGTIEIRTMATELGQGSHTVLAQIAAEVLDVPVENIKVLFGDTEISPFGHGAFSSRQTFNDGNAVRLACLNVKKQILEKAAKILNVNPDDLETKGGNILVTGSPQVALTIKDLFTPAALSGIPFVDEGGEFIGKATWYTTAIPIDPKTYQSKKATAFYAYNAQAVEVAVNIETGQVKILKHVSAADVGRAINPTTVEGQIEGGMHMGLGSTLMEKVIFKEGKVFNPLFTNYEFPTVIEKPDVTESIIVEANHPEGPFGAKGVGEATLTAGAPSIANAIYDAIGVRFKELPITPEKILEALQKKREWH